MFWDTFLKFVGEEWVFVFSVAGFILALIALLLTVIYMKEHKKTKIIVVIILSIVTTVCAISAISYIVLKNTGVSDRGEESSSESSSGPIETTSTNSEGTQLPALKLYAQPSPETSKWGYVDGNGKVVIPCTYDWADDFIDEYAAVCQHNNWGFIDSNGKEVISFEFNGAWSFIDGLAPVYNGDKWGFIDKNGNIKIHFKFAKIYRTYSNGHQVYTDENDNIIDYDAEMNNIAINSTTEAS